MIVALFIGSRPEDKPFMVAFSILTEYTVAFISSHNSSHIYRMNSFTYRGARGISTGGIVAIVAVLAAVGIGGYYLVSSRSSATPSAPILSSIDTSNPSSLANADIQAASTAPAPTATAPSNDGSVFSSYNGTCDWSGVKQVIQYSHTTGKPQLTLNYANGKLTSQPSKSGTVVDVSALEGVMCNTGAISGYQSLYQSSSGANSNGQWFSASSHPGGMVYINKTTENGQDVITMENRSPATTKGYENDMFVSSITVSAKTWLLLHSSSGFVPGTDLQLSKTVDQLGTGLTGSHFSYN